MPVAGVGDHFGRLGDAGCGEKAAAQYTAAIKGAYGAIAEPVLTGRGGGIDGDLFELERAGITKAILAGAGDGEGAVVAPDPLARVGAAELIEMWAADERPDAALVPGILRRVVESGAHLPVIRFVAQLDRAGIEATIAELEADKPGARQNRDLVIKDLRQALNEPAATLAAPSAKALLDAVEADESPEGLRAAADAALRDPASFKAELEDHAALTARIYLTVRARGAAAAAPPSARPRRLPGRRQRLQWWDRETNHQVRIDLVNAAAMLEPAAEVNELLTEALASKASVATAAARALAARGEDGYRILDEHLPASARGRAWVIKGVALAAERAPGAARHLAAKACYEPSSETYAAVRELDCALHLKEARQAAAGAAAERRPRAACPAAGSVGDPLEPAPLSV